MSQDHHVPSRSRAAVAGGVAVSLVSVAPIVIGAATLMLHWPEVPFNGTLALFVVVWVAALLHMHSASIESLAATLHTDTTAAIKQGRGETKKAARDLREEMRQLAKTHRVDTIVESVNRAHLRSVE